MTTSPLTGILWTLSFCVMSVLADGTLRYVTMHGFPSSEILFIRSFFGALILLPFVLSNGSIFHRNKPDLAAANGRSKSSKKIKFIIPKKSLNLYLARGFFAFLAMAIWFYILKFTDFTALVAVGFTASLFTSFFSIIYLREKFNGIKIAALIIGFVGAMVVINPMSVDFNWYLPFGVLSGLLWAISLIFAKNLSDKEHPVTATFFFALVLTPLALVIAIPVWQWPMAEELPLILLFCILATIGQLSLSKAFVHAPLTTLMPFEFSQLIFAAVFSYIIFGDIVTTNTILGGIIIFCGGYIVIRSERKHVREELEARP
jgi:drug/metabolite transporter (DMT)-like permease